MKRYIITHLQYRALREEIMRGLSPDAEVDAGRCLDILNVLSELPAPVEAETETPANLRLCQYCKHSAIWITEAPCSGCYGVRSKPNFTIKLGRER